MIPERFKEFNSVPVIALCIYFASILLIPFKIISYGYLPFDDALGRAAQVFSGKDWSQILVLRNGVTMDFHPGWYYILTIFHHLTGCGVEGLVIFSVVSLFILFFCVPAIFLKRPEAWLFALIVAILVEPIFLIRLTDGRPLMFVMSALIFILFIWDKFKRKNIGYVCLITSLTIAAAIWVHAAWYLFLLPITAFLLAREWRTAFAIGMCYAAAILLGALFTKHPILFLTQTFTHGVNVFSGNPRSSILVGELTPATGNVLILIAVALMLSWRALRNKWDIKRVDNPIFILGILGWVLGFAAFRFWIDWGLPALVVWMAREFESGLEGINYLSWKRITTTAIAGVILFLIITNNSNSRWTSNIDNDVRFISQKNPIQASWLPEPNGILYSIDMAVFYHTFYKNPLAEWRYMLGPEPTVMPEEDLEIYRNIMLNPNNLEAYKPWVQKMTLLDRLAIRSLSNSPPPISSLEWYQIVPALWIGRIPKK